eukprot:jgi/Chlat1/447/Chrsp103S00009
MTRVVPQALLIALLAAAVCLALLPAVVLVNVIGGESVRNRNSSNGAAAAATIKQLSSKRSMLDTHSVGEGSIAGNLPAGQRRLTQSSRWLKSKEAKERARQRMREMIAALEASMAQEEQGAPAPGPQEVMSLTLAEIIDEALEREFEKDETLEGGQNHRFNDSISHDEASLETVARVHTHDKKNTTDSSSQDGQKFLGIDLSSKDKDEDSKDVARLIDAQDNEFVISNPKNAAMELQEDWDLIKDFIWMVTTASVAGMGFGLVGQPVISGYLLAGSLIGPGGFGIIKELVQIETLAQFGVMFLLFCLGMEFSIAKLRHVRAVAIVGGALQVLLFMCFCGVLAQLSGAVAAQGVFVGAFLSMSSTAVVLKCLMDRGVMNSLQAQITVGTLVLQDVMVGLLFALLPVLGGSGTIADGAFRIMREITTMAAFMLLAWVLSRSLVPRFFRMLTGLSGQSWELYQLGALAFCLVVARTSDYCGLSIELGSFVAGVMVSSTEYSEVTLHQVEPIRNLFAALFMSSIGMIMNPAFLWDHLDILLASVLLLTVCKALLVTFVVKLFGYNMRTSLTVGMYMGNVGEFAFVLLSRASNLGLVQRNVYLLLLGTTALSLVSTPLVFRLTPHVIKLGSIMRWTNLREEESPVESHSPQQYQIPVVRTPRGAKPLSPRSSKAYPRYTQDSM